MVLENILTTEKAQFGDNVPGCHSVCFLIRNSRKTFNHQIQAGRGLCVFTVKQNAGPLSREGPEEGRERQAPRARTLVPS